MADHCKVMQALVVADLLDEFEEDEKEEEDHDVELLMVLACLASLP